MRKIVYDVAMSLDGFIAGEGDDVSLFPNQGDHVTDYARRLETYDTVFMDRRTYEFGCQFGLEPRSRTYLHMEHFIFSASLEVPETSDVTLIKDRWVANATG